MTPLVASLSDADAIVLRVITRGRWAWLINHTGVVRQNGVYVMSKSYSHVICLHCYKIHPPITETRSSMVHGPYSKNCSSNWW